MKNLKSFDSNYFIGKSHFEKDGTQKCLVFQPINRYFKKIASICSGNYIYYWKSKGLSGKRINTIKTPDYGTTPKLNYYGAKPRAEFNASCLKQDKITYTHGKMIHIYIVYELTGCNSNHNHATIKNFFFGTVFLTKNTDIDKYEDSGYGIGFDRKEIFHSWYYIRAKRNNFWSRHEFVKEE